MTPRISKKAYFFLCFFLCLCLKGWAEAPLIQEKIQEPLSRMKSKDAPFGVLEFLHWNHPWNNYKYSCLDELKKSILLMKEAGVQWVRMDFLWQDIEPQEGKLDFAKYDSIVQILTKDNINILGLLDYSADWASSCGQWNCPAKDNRLFVGYAVKVIARYKDRIKYWEVWNEPDSNIYWTEQDGLKSYCALLKEVYAQAKKIDPECKILNGGLADSPASANRLYENGAKEYFDIMNIHVFDSPLHQGAGKRVASYPKLVYKIMQRNQDAQKRIWITEIGCPGVKRGINTSNWWMGKNPSEKQQAAWVKEVYSQLLHHPQVDKVFWAFFRDCQGHWDNGTDYLGLLRWDFSRKPAFTSYKECVKEWKKVK